MKHTKNKKIQIILHKIPGLTLDKITDKVHIKWQQPVS